MSETRGPASIPETGPVVPDSLSWREHCSRALLYALADYPAIALAEITELSASQLQSLAKAASFVKQTAEAELGERAQRQK
jgi:hypothetical protein